MHWRFQWNLLRDWLPVKYVRRLFQLRPMMFTVCCNHTWCALLLMVLSQEINGWRVKGAVASLISWTAGSRALLQKSGCAVRQMGQQTELKPLTDHRCHLTHIISLALRITAWGTFESWAHSNCVRGKNILPKSKNSPKKYCSWETHVALTYFWSFTHIDAAIFR
jgi:hypothetical protein